MKGVLLGARQIAWPCWVSSWPPSAPSRPPWRASAKRYGMLEKAPPAVVHVNQPLLPLAHIIVRRRRAATSSSTPQLCLQSRLSGRCIGSGQFGGDARGAPRHPRPERLRGSQLAVGGGISTGSQ